MIKRIADRFFQWFCKPEYYSDIRGDLEELYNEHLETASTLRADLQYGLEIMFLCRPALIKSELFHSPISGNLMIKKNIILAFRQMWKQKLYAAIKILGFTASITACLLLFIYLQQEFTYDIHYSQGDRIYRVTVHYEAEDVRGVDFPAPFAIALQTDFPEIESAGRFLSAHWLKLARSLGQTTNRFEESIAYGDPELLDILQLPVKSGDPSVDLKRPNTLIISERVSRKYFGNDNPIGKSFIFNNDATTVYEIVGVFENFPKNSHLQFDFLLTLSGVEFWPGEQEYWGANMYTVYALIAHEAQAALLSDKLSILSTNYFLPSFREREFANPEELASNMSFGLQPVKSVYLNTAGVSDDLTHGDMRLYLILIIAGVLLLIIACINFTNLTIASSSARTKEIGIRKALGATRFEITNQFLVEATLAIFISVVVGIALSWFLLPYFNSIASLSLAFPWQITALIPGIIISALVLGLISGIYPSLILSKLKPASIIKGTASPKILSRFSQAHFVVFQFTASVVLISCTVIVYQQMQYILTKEVGFDKEQVLTIQGTHALEEKIDVFKEELRRLNGIEQVASSDYLPLDGSNRYHDSFWLDGLQNTHEGVNAQIWSIDYDYITTLGIEFVTGRNFSKSFSSDSSAIIVSASLANGLGLENPLGERITNRESRWNIIGVIEDFHFESLRSPISASSFILNSSASTLSIRFADNADREQLVHSAQRIWEELVPSIPLRYEFLDDGYADMHEDVQRSASLLNNFALLAILIACIGLFGLTIFVMERRTKEIGIRKVLGASIGDIVFLLTKEFAQPVLVSIIIATPIAWYMMQRWLEGFTFRTEIHWWIFLLSGAITLMIALLTVSFHSVKAAISNPVKAIQTH